MLHTELLDDILKLCILLFSGLGALYARKAHSVSKTIDKAVNGTSENEATIRENVQKIADTVVDDAGNGT